MSALPLVHGYCVCVGMKPRKSEAAGSTKQVHWCGACMLTPSKVPQAATAEANPQYDPSPQQPSGTRQLPFLSPGDVQRRSVALPWPTSHPSPMLCPSRSGALPCYGKTRDSSRKDVLRQIKERPDSLIMLFSLLPGAVQQRTSGAKLLSEGVPLMRIAIRQAPMLPLPPTTGVYQALV